jgi:photosystem II stability/assembly factor-like uncharacterized protein
MKKYVLSAVAIILLFTANAQWQVQNAGFTKDTLGFYEMSLPNQQTAWAVCYDGKNGLFSGRPVLDFTRTTDGGNTWIPGKVGTDRTLRFSNISAIDGQEAWVAMHKINFSKGGGVFHTIDEGVTWEQSNPDELFGNNSSPNFVYFKDRNHGVAMGDPNGGYWEIYTTNNKGKKWKRVPAEDLPAPLPNESGWISGYAAVGNTIWFGTTGGRVYKSVNFGKSWTVHTVDPAGKFVMEIAFNDDGLHGVAHLRNNFTFLYSTSDGGLTWTNLGQPFNWKSSRITSVPGTNAFVSTAVNNASFRGSAVSYDNGVTWTELERTTSKAVARFFDANTGYAGGFFVTGPPFNGGIYKSQIAFQLPSSNHNRIGDNKLAGIQFEKNPAETDVTVYPSPASNVVTISLPVAFVKTTSVISIVTMDGKVIETRKSKATNSIQMDVSKLTPGLYVLRIQSGTQVINKTISIVR